MEEKEEEFVVAMEIGMISRLKSLKNYDKAQGDTLQ